METSRTKTLSRTNYSPTPKSHELRQREFKSGSVFGTVVWSVYCLRNHSSRPGNVSHYGTCMKQFPVAARAAKNTIDATNEDPSYFSSTAPAVRGIRHQKSPAFIFPFGVNAWVSRQIHYEDKWCVINAWIKARVKKIISYSRSWHAT